jgi:uncharacterized protein (TIGR02271 family)
MIEPAKAEHLFDCEVLDTYGETVGPVGQVWLANGTGQPIWASVRVGTLAPAEHTLPLHTAELHDQQIHVPYSKEHILQAPDVDPTREAMAIAEHTALTVHYDLPANDGSLDHEHRTSQDSDSAAPTWSEQLPSPQGRPEFLVPAASDLAPISPHDPETGDHAATGSEEQLVVHTEQVPAGRVRLVKYVVTELQQVTIEVSREEVRLEREPITDGEPVTSAHDLMLENDTEPEVTLYAERPVIQMEVVPVEQVRIAKTTVTDERTVAGLVRSEHIDSNDDTDHPRS